MAISMRIRAGLAVLTVVAALFAWPGLAGSSATHDEGPKVVFQINDAENASTVLRFVTNYLVAEPNAKVTVVGYASGIDFMLVDAKDKRGNAYDVQLQALADRGVAFKVCNNTLNSRNLSTDSVWSRASVVPSAVNEIIRLQTREGYAYFQHVK